MDSIHLVWATKSKKFEGAKTDDNVHYDHYMLETTTELATISESQSSKDRVGRSVGQPGFSGVDLEGSSYYLHCEDRFSCTRVQD
jgi:hypothetical protein